jgi:hypothetical protein
MLIVNVNVYIPPFRGSVQSVCTSRQFRIMNSRLGRGQKTCCAVRSGEWKFVNLAFKTRALDIRMSYLCMGTTECGDNFTYDVVTLKYRAIATNLKYSNLISSITWIGFIH